MDRSELTDLARRERESWRAARLRCCTASGCLATGAGDVKTALEQAVTGQGLDDRVQVVGVGCLGLCGRGPLVELAPPGALFERVSAATAPSLVGAAAGATPQAEQVDSEHPFFRSQLKVVCETSGQIDSERVEEYVA